MKQEILRTNGAIASYLAVVTMVLWLIVGCGSGGESRNVAGPVATSISSGGGADADTEASQPAPTTAPAATATPTPTPMPTATPTTVPAPTATPPPTPTPEPLDLLTLDDAKSGISGQNWIAVAPVHDNGTVPTFDADGNPTDYFDTAPNGEQFPVLLGSPSYFGNPQHLLVLSGTPEDEFVEVLIPAARPGGRTAWLRSEDLTFNSSDYVIGMDVATGVLEVWRQGERVFFDEVINEADAVTASVPHVQNGVANWSESIAFDREHFHPLLAAVSSTTACDDCENVMLVSIRGEGPEFDRDTFFAELEAAGGDPGYSMWISRDGLAEFMELVPIGSRIEITGGSDDLWADYPSEQ